MAFAHSSSSKPEDGPVKVDIIFVPGIGAEPRKTWRPHPDDDHFECLRLDYVLDERLYPNAQTHLYDHLTREERNLEIIPAQGPNDKRHNASVEAFAAAEAHIAEYGIGQWADRLLGVLQQHRRVQETSQRPILFLCHSTGGIVAKQALSRKVSAGESDIAALCIGIIFFATPHHGSSVLSEPEYAKTVRENLDLKWEMSQHLRHEFRLRNTVLETLNYRFAVSIAGVKIISYVEGMDTNLAVLSTDHAGVESSAVVQLFVVDSRSGKLGTSEVHLEDEEVIQLNDTHVGAPRFEAQDKLYRLYIDEIVAFVKGFSPEESAAIRAFENDIMTSVGVDVHQFYEDRQGIKSISAHPCLRSFLEMGSAKCMEDRLSFLELGPAKCMEDRLRPLPRPSSNRFKWIHVPFSHAGWVPQILTTISQEKRDLSLHTKVLMDRMWISQHNRSLHASPHARFVRPSVRCLLPPSVEQSHRGGVATLSSATRDIQLVVYLPYLHWDSFKNLQKREAVMKRRIKQQQAHPIAKDVALGRSMELKVIWQYLSSDLPLHCRRTLDQYGNPNLRNTSYRDQSQTLYKRTRTGGYALPTKEPRLKSNFWSSATRQFLAADADIDADTVANTSSTDETGKVLMVDQLWLWILDNQTVVTFFTSKEREENDNGLWGEGDVRSEIYQDINGDYPNQCENPYDFAALVVFHAIKALLERATARDLQIFRIHDEYISVLTESQIDGFKRFRDNQRFSMTQDKSALPYFDNRDELNALLELRDVDDELTTITKLIKEQQACVSDMVAQYQDLNKCNKGLNGINFLVEVQQFLSEQMEQINEMLKISQSTQTAFKELLDMKQKDAIRISQQQTEKAADSSRSIMVFTVFTIIFSPLSFFASVFGINAREWSGVETNPSLRNVFAYMVSISFAFIVLALLLAFNKNMRRLSHRAWRSATIPILGLIRLLCYYPRRWYHAEQPVDVERPAASTRKKR